MKFGIVFIDEKMKFQICRELGLRVIFNMTIEKANFETSIYIYIERERERDI